MVLYRLIGENDFDVSIVTDASDNHKEFFITDIQGLDADEVKAGFDIEIEQHNEGELIEFAKAKNLTLFSYDAGRGSRQIHPEPVEGIPFGILNGTTSQVTYTDAVAGARLAGGSNVRIYEFDIKREAGDGDFVILIESATADVDDANAVYAIHTVSSGNMGVGFMFVSGGAPLTFFGPAPGQLSPDTEWHSYKLTITEGAGSSTYELFYDETPATMQQVVNSGIPSNVYDTFTNNVYLTGDSLSGDPFLGSIKNVKLTVNGTVVIDNADPSTGSNSGTGSDGVVVDVEQGLIV